MISPVDGTLLNFVTASIFLTEKVQFQCSPTLESDKSMKVGILVLQELKLSPPSLYQKENLSDDPPLKSSAKTKVHRNQLWTTFRQKSVLDENLLLNLGLN